MGVHKINVLYKWLTAVKIYSHSLPSDPHNPVLAPFPADLQYQEVAADRKTKDGIRFPVNANGHGFIKILFALYHGPGQKDQQ